MSAQDELAEVIVRAYGHPQAMAKAALAAGYRKPKIVGYLVLGRDGQVIGKQFTEREAAQAFADEWTLDCKTAGIDWDYRVAEIVEAAS